MAMKISHLSIHVHWSKEWLGPIALHARSHARPRGRSYAWDHRHLPWPQ